MTTSPSLSTLGLRHVALNCHRLEACVDFYVNILGMSIEWQPDEDNYYLTTGHDNFALHRSHEEPAPWKKQHLDHIGFILATVEDVDAWYDKLNLAGVEIAKAIKTHRDGARSFYVKDPDGVVVQMIYHPPLAPNFS